jgi:hypothetical protein
MGVPGCSEVTVRERLRIATCIVVLASDIMTNLRRTTVTAPDSALQTLEAEARRRSVSLSTVLREAVEEKAHALRTRRRPSLGIWHSGDGLSAAELTAEPVAEDFRD